MFSEENNRDYFIAFLRRKQLQDNLLHHFDTGLAARFEASKGAVHMMAAFLSDREEPARFESSGLGPGRRTIRQLATNDGQSSK